MKGNSMKSLQLPSFMLVALIVWCGQLFAAEIAVSEPSACAEDGRDEQRDIPGRPKYWFFRVVTENFFVARPHGCSQVRTSEFDRCVSNQTGSEKEQLMALESERSEAISNANAQYTRCIDDATQGGGAVDPDDAARCSFNRDVSIQNAHDAHRSGIHGIRIRIAAAAIGCMPISCGGLGIITELPSPPSI